MADAGKQVGVAFDAVRRCHADVGRLIADLDDHMTKDGWRRIWKQDAVTYGVSRAAYAPYWMAKMLYRLYRNDDSAPGIVDGINIRFFADDNTLDEPRLVIGRARYTLPRKKRVGSVADTWDFDEGYGGWCKAKPDDLGNVLSCSNAERAVEKMCVTAVNLYSITSLDDVTSKLNDVRQEFERTEVS